ncbi:MAG: class I SAM-dependent methyltransferase [Polyangiaceae bacterium]|jgi:caffeoyl-CoA O-methyltransferase|nr:class I SAM-dependent methyltransferase [Polyangiaceae bacterium]MBK8937144.1 class I SAM-dependent methyltransferase [Polyangiaceae bacterium]
MVPLIDLALERYTAEHTTPPCDLLAELAVVTREKMAAFNMQVGPVEGAFLRLLVGLSGASRVLEIGTFTGYSALSMAEALPPDGRLVTCDVDEAVVAIARSFFDRSPHGSKIEVRMGDAKATLAALRGETFDLVFLDADKAAYVDYYELAVPMLAPGGLLVADNALWSGRVLAPVSDDDRGVDAFNRRVTADPRVDNVLLSVRDGIMLARKL